MFLLWFVEQQTAVLCVPVSRNGWGNYFNSWLQWKSYDSDRDQCGQFSNAFVSFRNVRFFCFVFSVFFPQFKMIVMLVTAG